MTRATVGGPAPHGASEAAGGEAALDGLDQLVSRHAADLRCIFCDLDGTLLREGAVLPDGFTKAFHALRSTGVDFVPATGRTLWAARRLMGDLADQMDFVAGNGMDVVVGGSHVTHLEYDRDMAQDLLGAVRDDPGRPALVAYGQGTPRVINMSLEEFLTPVRSSNGEGTAGRAPFEAGAELPPGPLLKLAVIARDDAEGLAARMTRAFSGQMAFTPCGRHWIDVPLPGAGKDKGASTVLGHLGATSAQAAAFGDSMNDSDLMDLVGAPVAVANALPALLPHCRYLVGSNQSDAVVGAMLAIARARG